MSQHDFWPAPADPDRPQQRCVICGSFQNDSRHNIDPAAAAGASPREEKCVIGEYCRSHGFIHGAEAEELRQGVEKLLEDTKWDDVGRPLRQMMRGLLDAVDARDSSAFVSTTEGVKAGLSASSRVSQEEPRCVGELKEAGELVCKCSHGKDGICGFRAEPADMSEWNADYEVALQRAAAIILKLRGCAEDEIDDNIIASLIDHELREPPIQPSAGPVAAPLPAKDLTVSAPEFAAAVQRGTSLFAGVASDQVCGMADGKPITGWVLRNAFNDTWNEAIKVLRAGPVAASSLLTGIEDRLKLVQKCTNPKPCPYCDRAFTATFESLAALAALRGPTSEKVEDDPSRVDGVPVLESSLGSTAAGNEAK